MIKEVSTEGRTMNASPDNCHTKIKNMAEKKKNTERPKNGLRPLLCMIAVTILLLLLIQIVFSRKADLYFNLASEGLTPEDVSTVWEQEGIAEVTDITVDGSVARVTLHSLSSGSTMLTVAASGEDEQLALIHVNRFLAISDWVSYSIGGYVPMLVVLTLSFFSIAFFLLRMFWDRKNTELYSYRSIYRNGFGLFILSLAVSLLYILINTLRMPSVYNGLWAVDMLVNAGWNFMFISIPFITVFALVMFISNISLMRHESVRIQNALGIIFSLLLIGGMVLALLMNRSFEGSELMYQIWTFVFGSLCMVYVYFECMLLGSIICGITAARQYPPYDMDYIVILGCAMRKDGTPYPLLQGRIDRAVGFYREQIEKTGKVPILIPSGAQGRNEVCSEAECMKNYMLSLGVPEEHIIMEEKATNTFQNMQFSKEIIEKRNPHAKVAFSTTNYHVFRSGLWSRRAGFYPLGMGSRTKWYFWPNAFVREVAGLLEAEKKMVNGWMALFLIAYAIQVWIMFL